jgi:hypothetical protein
MRSLRLVLSLTFVSCTALAQAPTAQPVHRSGPHGLDGWVLLGGFPPELQEYNEYPTTLVIARHGHIIRRIQGDPFLWGWMFTSDGRRVAYSSGPLHFGMTCMLIDIGSGKAIDDYDCYHDLPDDAPNWVKALTANPNR